jgi:hypothetical protein
MSRRRNSRHDREAAVPQHARSLDKGTVFPSDLQRLFDELNEKHWNGKLPTVPLRFARLGRALGTCGKRGIYIDRRHIASVPWRQSKNLLIDSVEDTMLHEMAHLATPGSNHGRAFRREGKRVGLRDVDPLKQGVMLLDHYVREMIRRIAAQFGPEYIDL